MTIISQASSSASTPQSVFGMQANSQKSSASKSGSEWGPAVVVTLSSTAKSYFEAAKAKLSAPWQSVLDRLMQKPGSASEVFKSFFESAISNKKKQDEAVQLSSLSKASTTKRDQLLKQIKMLKEQIEAETGARANSKSASRVKALVSELKQLSGQLQATINVSSLASIGQFDGASIANKAIDGVQNITQSSGADAGSDGVSANTVSVEQAAAATDATMLTEKQMISLVDTVSTMQNMTDRAAQGRDDLINAEAQVNADINDVIDMIKKLVEKGEKFVKAYEATAGNEPDFDRGLKRQ